MDLIVDHLFTASGTVFAPATLLIIAAGVVFGIILGALPGFGASQSLALLFPLTFGMSPAEAVLFFIAVYSAAEYGGSIPAILIRTPGTAASAITAIDGYAMARKGLAGKALRISLVSGVIGGLISTVIFLFAGTSLAWIGLKFGPGEMFALGLFGLAIIGGFFGSDPAKGFFATGIGLLLATIGTSDFGGMRFTFGQGFLMDGIPLEVLVIGLMAGPEALRLLINNSRTKEEFIDLGGRDDRARNRISGAEFRRLIPTWIRSSLIGTAVGTLPGPGATVGSLIAHAEERRWSKRGPEFGTGVEEAVAAPEAANNAVVAGTLVPSLALGIPGSGAAAILLGALISKGVVPGPLLFQESGDLVMAIFIGLIVCNIMMLVLGLLGSIHVAKIVKVPRRIMGPFVMLLVIIGSYAYANYPAHVLMALALAAGGYLFDRLRIPTVPVVLAFVMGPIIELNISRALTLHRGDLFVVLERPITLIILGLAVVTALYSFSGILGPLFRRLRGGPARPAEGSR